MARAWRIPQELHGLSQPRRAVPHTSCAAGLLSRTLGVARSCAARCRQASRACHRRPLATQARAALLLDGWRVPRTGANFCRVIISSLDAASHKNRRSVSHEGAGPCSAGRLPVAAMIQDGELFHRCAECDCQADRPSRRSRKSIRTRTRKGAPLRPLRTRGHRLNQRTLLPRSAHWPSEHSRIDFLIDDV